MRTRIATMVVSIALLTGQTSSAQSATENMAAVNKALADLLAGYTQRDMDAIARVMADDVKAFGSTYSAAGVEEFRRKAAPALAMVRAVRPASKQDVSMSGNIAYVAFMLDTDRQTGPGAAPATARVRWTVVFERRNSRWVVTHFHISPEPAS